MTDTSECGHFDRTEPFKGAEEKYLKVFPKIKNMARAHGYAIAIHGSMRRGLDLVAVPWVFDASDMGPLVRDLCIACEGVLQNENNPTEKPFGIMSWNIMLGGNLYIDLKVIPKERASNDRPTQAG